MDDLLPGFDPTPAELVRSLPRAEREARAIELLQAHEPADGYYLADSGGKDSCVILWLAMQAGVKFTAYYNNTTIDPPELVRFLKQHHAGTIWNQPRLPMMKRIAEAPKVPPTRTVRWCCSEYKEAGGHGRTKIMGVRQQESKARARRWWEISVDMHDNPTICPVVYWTVEQIWETIHANQIPYCPLYDEGWERIGCVGCPIASQEMQDKEFARWPAYERNWKKAVVANWEKWKDRPIERNGKRKGLQRYQQKFKTGEDFWVWWRTYRAPDYMREDCQSGLLWTNQE